MDRLFFGPQTRTRTIAEWCILGALFIPFLVAIFRIHR